MAARASRTSVWSALHDATRVAAGHWRWLLLAWIASIPPAWLAARPIARMFDAALGRHPDAGRILGEFDLAALHDALSMATSDRNTAAIFLGMLLAGLLALLLSPLVDGMLVAALRAGRPLGFGESWRGGWREYGRMFRLLLLSLLPFAAALAAMAGAFEWAAGEDPTMLEARVAQREWIAGIASAGLLLLVFSSLEAARAAFATDPALRSAWRAWRRGLRLLGRRPFAVLLVVLFTLATGLLLSIALNWIGIGPRHDLLVLACAQLAVLGVAWTRAARLGALAGLAPPLSSRTVPAAPADAGHTPA